MMDHVPAQNQDASERRSRRASWFVRRPYLAAFLAGSLAMAFVVLRKNMTEFEWVYVLSARNLLAGQGLYQLKIPPFRSYTYPPFMALMSIPFAVVPETVGRVAWFLVNLACVLMAWRGCWKLTGGGTLEGADPSSIDRREHHIAVLGLVCALPYLQSGVAHQQTDLLIAALLTAGCLSLVSARDLLAGVSFGVAAGMKCTPLLWAPYLAWKGRWRAALLVPVVAVGVNLLPEAIHTAPGGGWWLAAWIEQFLRPMAQPDYVPGRWFAWILDNQSLAGTVGRWATTVCAWGPEGITVVERATPWGATTLRLITLGIEGLIFTLAWFALRRGRARQALRADGIRPPLNEPTEFSVVLLLMLLFSPMSSRPHFAITLLPAVCLARRAVSEGRRGLYIPLIAMAVTSVLGLPFWGRSAGRLIMWSGALMWGTLALLAGCFCALTIPGKEAQEGAVPNADSARNFVDAPARAA